MGLWKLMFGSPYDLSALIVTAIALAVHVAIDVVRRRGRQGEP